MPTSRYDNVVLKSAHGEYIAKVAIPESWKTFGRDLELTDQIALAKIWRRDNAEAYLAEGDRAAYYKVVQVTILEAKSL